MADSGTPSQSYSSRQIITIAVCSILALISNTAVALRFLARYSTRTWWWWDDALCLLGLGASWVMNAVSITGATYGLGSHAKDLSPRNQEMVGLYTFLHQVSWAFAMFFTIECIMWFYLRIFPQRWMRISFWVIGGVVTAWLLTQTLVLVFQCTPTQAFWIHNIPNSTCFDMTAGYLTTSLINVVTLFVTLVLPLPTVWRLQMSWTKRIGLVFAFSIGMLVLIISIYRLYAVYTIDLSDPSYAFMPGVLVSVAEVNIAIVSACIPSLVPLFLIVAGKRQSRSRPHGYSPSPRPGTLPSRKSTKVYTTKDYFDGTVRSESFNTLVQTGSNRNYVRLGKKHSGESNGESLRRPQSAVLPRHIEVEGSAPRPSGVPSEDFLEDGIRVTHEIELVSKPRSQDSVLREGASRSNYALGQRQFC